MMPVVRKDHFRVYPKPEPGLYRVKRQGRISSPEVQGLLPIMFFSRLKSSESDLIEFEAPSGIDESAGSLRIPVCVNIADGDIFSINQRGTLRVILHRHANANANANTLLVTEQCNNLCVFCSQPPIETNDDWLYSDSIKAIIDFDSDELVGISGGEPLLNEKYFLRLLSALDNSGNQTPLHVLTNGRALSKIDYCKSIKIASCHRLVTFGVPLYSFRSEVHDELVGSVGAWKETMLGLVNAQTSQLRVELRIIPMAQNLDDISALLKLLGKTLPMIDQVSIMNLEPQGYARKNWHKIYVSPQDYAKRLIEWVHLASIMGLPLKLFNYPLCQIPEEVAKLAEQSISDWKNSYPKECDSCQKRKACCGVFSSATTKFLSKVQPFK